MMAKQQHSGHQMITRSKSQQVMLSISSSLPQDFILSEILPRVSSVKSLLRFKCISRSWLSHISSNNFVTTHVEYSVKKNTPLTDQNAILVSATSQGFALLHCLARSLFSRSYMNVDHFQSRYLQMSGHVPRIVGCCNGLCCVLISGQQFALGNPSIGESRGLPPVLNYEFARVTIHGFGYDESNDDYKVVAVLRTHLSPPQHVFRLFSLKTNSWKTIDDFLGGDTCGGIEMFGGRGAFVNGKLHWMNDNFLKIVSFDLGMEAVGVVEPPCSPKRLFQRMGVIKGCLAVVCDNSNEGTEVWAMKEYGVKESWCRVAIVPYFGTFSDNPFNYALYVSEDGVVVTNVDRRSILFIYNPKTELVKRLRLKAYETSQVDFCIQTLVSPFRHGELEEPN